MAHSTTTVEAAKAAIAKRENLRSECERWTASRLLSALGHPGYGAAYAGQVIAEAVTYGVSVGAVIYGHREYLVARFEAVGR